MRHLHPIPYAVIAVVAVSAAVANVVFALSAGPAGPALSAAEGPVPIAAEAALAVETVSAADVFEEAPPRSSEAKLGLPMIDALQRVTKKPFGIEIHPETSPVPDDRFNGFHVGVDFETFEIEQDVDVPVYAICDGPLLFKKYATGYGGVAVQKCAVDGREISVIYGHLRLASVAAEAGDTLARGKRLGVLGTGHSEETDGVRKHLHLGVRADSTTDIRGYVKDAAEIGQWLDALSYFAP